MTRIGISITKTTPFRNSNQEFTNVYYYQSTGALPDETGALALIDGLVALEKTWHGNAATFVRGRCWSAGGTKAENNMIAQKNLSGVGSQASNANMDKERAILIRWRAGSDSRGNPVYLRKWYHPCGAFDASVNISSTILQNTTGFSSVDRATMEAKVNSINTRPEGGGGWELVAKSGRQRTLGAAKAHEFFEHHQLGDQWRAQ